MTNQLEMVDGTLQPISDADQAAYDAQQSSYASALPDIIIKQQISVLEASQTPRRMRESLTDPTWLNNLNVQITALRSGLK